jgi:putative peptidoglycan lipid II flippase
MLKSTIQVTLFSILSIAINFVIQLLLAYYFGASDERDTYFAASSIPIYINAIISGSLVVVFLPRLIDIEINKSGDASALVSCLVTFTILLMIVIALPFIFFSTSLVDLLFQGFDGTKTALTAELLVILTPVIFFQALSNILIALYHANKSFLKPALSILITPIVTILVTFILEGRFGIKSVAIGSSIGWIVTFLFLQFATPVKYSVNFPLLRTNRDFHYCLRKSTPLFLGSLLYRGNTVIEKMVASNFSGGVISYLGYASSIVTLLSTVTVNGIATTMFPQLSRAWSEKNIEKFRRFYANSIKVTFILCVPVIITSIVFSKTIIATILERGAFDQNDTTEVSYLLTLLMGSYLFLCLNTIPGKIFYITGITGLGLFNAILEVAIYIGLCLWLPQLFSYYGIAYAQIISVACSTLFASILLQIKFKILNVQSLPLDFLKIVVCGLLSYGLMNTYSLWFKESFLTMTIFGGGAVLIYFYALSIIMKEAREVRYMIQGKFKNLFFSK